VNELDEMWLRMGMVTDEAMLHQYQQLIKRVVVVGEEEVLKDATQVKQLHTAASELSTGLSSLLGITIAAQCCSNTSTTTTTTQKNGTLHVEVGLQHGLGDEGFAIDRNDGGGVRVRANTASGALYGSFRLLSYIQRSEAIPGGGGKGQQQQTHFISIPAMELRVWDMWDDLSGDVTRGFAGDSLIWPQAMWKDPNDPNDGP
jgi:alpha-glucuronidase